MRYQTAHDLIDRALAGPSSPPPPPEADDHVRVAYIRQFDRFYATARFLTYIRMVEDFVAMHGARSASGSSALLVLDGIPATGKSAAGYMIAEHLTRKALQDSPVVDVAESATVRRVPVVCIQLVHINTLKAGLLEPILHFYGASTGRLNMAEMLRVIRRLARQHGTILLIVDEISQVRLGRDQEAKVDQLKELVEAFPAPILFAGNRLDQNSVFSAGADSADPRHQLRQRAEFVFSGLWTVDEVKQLAGSIERDLPLRDHESGSIDYEVLHRLCGGYPPKVVNLLRAAALRAIADGSETISTDSLLGERVPR